MDKDNTVCKSVWGPASTTVSRKYFNQVTAGPAAEDARWQLPYTPNQMLEMRLRARLNEMFEHVNVFKSKTGVHIFVVQGGEAVVLGDDPAMFPSDSLVSQLRLLAKSV